MRGTTFGFAVSKGPQERRPPSSPYLMAAIQRCSCLPQLSKQASFGKILIVAISHLIKSESLGVEKGLLDTLGSIVRSYSLILFVPPMFNYPRMSLKILGPY